MAYNKKTWLARLGQGLNKFIFNGGSKVTLDSSPDVVTQEGTALSAENMNDLEQRIADEFGNVSDAISAIKPIPINTEIRYRVTTTSWQYTGLSVTIPSYSVYSLKATCNYYYSRPIQIAISENSTTFQNENVAIGISDTSMNYPVATLIGRTGSSSKTLYVWTKKESTTSDATEPCYINGFYIKYE